MTTTTLPTLFRMEGNLSNVYFKNVNPGRWISWCEPNTGMQTHWTRYEILAKIEELEKRGWKFVKM